MQSHGLLWAALASVALVGAVACASSIPTGVSKAESWPTAETIAPPVAPDNNPTTAVKAELGRRLFYDADLSFTGVMSCATCHEQTRGFADPNKTRAGVFGDPGERNIQTLANVGYFSSLTWGGPQVDILEHQALIPIEGLKPVEMGFNRGPEGALPQRLKDQPCYPKLFAAAFPEKQGEISMDTITMALSAFQRTLVSLDAPYDRYRRGDLAAISAQAKRGETLFEAKQCSSCHAGVHFTDAALAEKKPVEAFHVLAPPAPGETLRPDTGLHRITQKVEDIYKFRTPSLRNVAVSAPYMHDGEDATLADAVRHHFAAADRQSDARLTQVVSEAEIADLVAFLEALTDQSFISNPRFALPPPGCPIPDTPGQVRDQANSAALHNSPPGP
jgi:cytochrome c peroxidase